MDSERRPSNKKDDPLDKQPSKDELNEHRVNEGCAAPNTNTENPTEEARKDDIPFCT